MSSRNDGALVSNPVRSTLHSSGNGGGGGEKKSIVAKLLESLVDPASGCISILEDFYKATVPEPGESMKLSIPHELPIVSFEVYKTCVHGERSGLTRSLIITTTQFDHHKYHLTHKKGANG